MAVWNGEEVGIDCRFVMVRGTNATGVNVRGPLEVDILLITVPFTILEYPDKVSV